MHEYFLLKPRACALSALYMRAATTDAETLRRENVVETRQGVVCAA